MVTVFASHSDIDLYIVTDLILLDYGIAAFDNENSFFIVFVDFIANEMGKGILFHLHSSFPVEPNQMVVHHLSAILLPFNQDSVQTITHNCHVLGYLGLAQESFVGTAKNPISSVLFDFVQHDRGKSTMDFDSLIVFCDNVPTDLWLAS